MRVAFDQRALVDLEDIHRFISSRSLSSSARVINQLLADVDRLAQFPYIGRKISENAREWVVPRLPYIIAYEIDDLSSVVTVTALFMTRETDSRH